VQGLASPRGSYSLGLSQDHRQDPLAAGRRGRNYAGPRQASRRPGARSGRSARPGQRRSRHRRSAHSRSVPAPRRFVYLPL